MHTSRPAQSSVDVHKTVPARRGAGPAVRCAAVVLAAVLAPLAEGFMQLATPAAPRRGFSGGNPPDRCGLFPGGHPLPGFSPSFGHVRSTPGAGSGSGSSPPPHGGALGLFPSGAARASPPESAPLSALRYAPPPLSPSVLCNQPLPPAPRADRSAVEPPSGDGFLRWLQQTGGGRAARRGDATALGGWKKHKESAKRRVRRISEEVLTAPLPPPPVLTRHVSSLTPY